VGRRHARLSIAGEGTDTGRIARQAAEDLNALREGATARVSPWRRDFADAFPYGRVAGARDAEPVSQHLHGREFTAASRDFGTGAGTPAQHAIVLHVKDCDIYGVDTRMGFHVVGAPAGAGKVNFPMVLRALKSYEREPSVILAHCPPFTEEKWVQQSMTVLRTWVNGNGSSLHTP
jgi:hypothetical protein